MSNSKNLLKIYAVSLNAYPKPFRDHYGEEMFLTVVDMLEDADSSWQRTAIWTRVIVDFLPSVLHEQLYKAGEIMKKAPTYYVNRNALVSGLLLAPFAWAVVNRIMNQFFHSYLFGGNAWMANTVGFILWAIVLPLAALGLSAGTYLSIKSAPTLSNKGAAAATDLKLMLPIVMSGCLALAVILTVIAAFIL